MCFLLCSTAFSQEEFPFFEQLAFDHFAETVLDSFPEKRRIKVPIYIWDLHEGSVVFPHPSCTGLKWKSHEQFELIASYNEDQSHFESDKLELSLFTFSKKQFKIKSREPKGFPRLYITAPHYEKGNCESIYVNLRLRYRYEWIDYHYEFNAKGEIIYWCRQAWVSVRNH